MQQNSLTFEVCIDAPSGLEACEGLVDRVELCSALDLGGLTPDPGLIALAKEHRFPCHAMIRPRAGDFHYNAADQHAMLASVAAVKKAGLAGIVVGASIGNALDTDLLRALKSAAGNMEVTLHRVIDLVDAPLLALEQVIALGFDRILTSGGAPKAVDGLTALAALHNAAAGRIEIMAGSGISVSNLAKIANETQITSFHASCSTEVPVADHLHRFGFAKTQKVTDRATVATFRDVLNSLV
ncbi:copper homeostasis protein CutC [Shimia sp. NS0008-38b]|uniref:copper homeostasis protein CutC n=1 Tax=Shimia sp. NS0008-38b TaxID=3127653 RepID=UPI003105C717